MTHGRPFRWTRQHLGRLVPSPTTTAPIVRSSDLPPLLQGEYTWDMWPVQEPDGSPTVVLGAELWMTLSAPVRGHPEDRHDVARLRLLARKGGAWRDLDHVFPAGASPGSREWSGSAVRRPDGSVSVYYTAAGHRGEARRSYVQRVFEARAQLVADGGPIRLDAAEHRELVRPDGRMYLLTDQVDGGPGRIGAFRDPGWFRDPADGREYLLIAASVPWRGRFMGAVALAAERAGGWSLRPPLVQAAGINHEIERPQLVAHAGRYYLFFCMQRHVFHPPGSAPTGLYGFVAAGMEGPWEPLNRSGLVIQNPPSEPDQAYAWLVLPDLRVVSFLNYRSSRGSEGLTTVEDARIRFGGTVAPTLRIALHGATSCIVEHSPAMLGLA